jgi:hypothetical protein
LTSLVQNYLTFNHWHSDHPGVSLLSSLKCQKIFRISPYPL